MTASQPVIAWRGATPPDATDPDTPLVVLLHGRGSDEADIVAHGDSDVVIPADLQSRTWTYLHDEAGSTTTGVRDPGGHGLSAHLVGELQGWLGRLTLGAEIAGVPATTA